MALSDSDSDSEDEGEQISDMDRFKALQESSFRQANQDSDDDSSDDEKDTQDDDEVSHLTS
jgi:hypothetical protein